MQDYKEYEEDYTDYTRESGKKVYYLVGYFLLSKTAAQNCRLGGITRTLDASLCCKGIERNPACRSRGSKIPNWRGMVETREIEVRGTKSCLPKLCAKGEYRIIGESHILGG